MPRRSIIATKCGKKTFGKRKRLANNCAEQKSRCELFYAVANDSGAKV